MWRLAAWMISAVVLAVHIAYEYFRLNSSPLITALHTAVAVAIGAFGLAVVANVHELAAGSTYRYLLALALVAWPLLTGVPAFVVALISTYALALIRRRT